MIFISFYLKEIVSFFKDILKLLVLGTTGDVLETCANVTNHFLSHT
jgi:hypothetical protein